MEFSSIVVAWLAASAIYCISGWLLVGSVEVKVKTWTTTSADAVPSSEASSLCTSPSRRVANIAGENLTLSGGVCCHRRWIGIGVKVKALAHLWAGDSDARGRRLPC